MTCFQSRNNLSIRVGQASQSKAFVLSGTCMSLYSIILVVERRVKPRQMVIFHYP